MLVHWTDSSSEAEKKALEISELFDGFRDMETADHIIKFADVRAVRSIGKDEKGICEYKLKYYLENPLLAVRDAGKKVFSTLKTVGSKALGTIGNAASSII